jgi:hypothetical protein
MHFKIISALPPKFPRLYLYSAILLNYFKFLLLLRIIDRSIAMPRANPGLPELASLEGKLFSYKCLVELVYLIIDVRVLS